MYFSEKLNRALDLSCICIGLDPDLSKLPECVRKKSNPVSEFIETIIRSTRDKAGAYKLNFAFYEALGARGWNILKDTVSLIRHTAPEALLIADAKRGDIGNTAEQYARAITEDLDFDCITVNPYMGYDSVEPFIRNPGKGAFILCLTSNPGSKDFQYLSDGTMRWFEHVALRVRDWNHNKNCGLVVGATHPGEMQKVRDIAGDMPFLIPGVGAQGGDLESSLRVNWNGYRVLALINASRTVLYAGDGESYGEAAAKAVHQLNQDIVSSLEKIKNVTPE